MADVSFIHDIIATQSFQADMVSGKTAGECGEFSTELCISLLKQHIPVVMVSNNSHGGTYHIFLLVLIEEQLLIVDPSANQYLQGMQHALVGTREAIQHFLASNHPYVKPDPHLWDGPYEELIDLILPHHELDNVEAAGLMLEVVHQALEKGWIIPSSTLDLTLQKLESMRGKGASLNSP